MRLREGFTAADSIKALDLLIQEAGNIHIDDQAKRKYLAWVDTAEYKLREIFPDDTIADGLLTRRHERIDRDYSHPPTQGLNIALQAEMAKQRARLNEMIMRLKKLAVLADRPGEPVILDCNVFMHCQMFNEVDWRREIGHDHTRIILPVAVIDELDKMKYMERGNRQDRARKVLKALDRYLPALEADGIAGIRTKTTLEILVDEPGHQRLRDSDSEIIDRGVLLRQAMGKPVLMVTNDRGMRVKAHARGLSVWPVPEHLLVPSATPAAPEG